MRKILLFFLFAHFAAAAVGQYANGHYYSLQGEKKEGFLKFNYGGKSISDKSFGDCSVDFKEKRVGKKKRFTTKDICCFVIETDSFAVIKNLKLNEQDFYAQDFAQVVEKGKIILFNYFSIAKNANDRESKSDWAIQKDEKVEILNEGNFSTIISSYVNDHPELSRKENLRYSEIQKIVKTYNEFFKK